MGSEGFWKKVISNSNCSSPSLFQGKGSLTGQLFRAPRENPALGHAALKQHQKIGNNRALRP